MASQLDHWQPLFRPKEPGRSATFRFMSRINSLYSLNLTSYQELYQWSVDNIDLFWQSVWDETNIVGVRGRHSVNKFAPPSANVTWFSDARLNWAENMLQNRSNSKTAVIQAGKLLLPVNIIRYSFPLRLIARSGTDAGLPGSSAKAMHLSGAL